MKITKPMIGMAIKMKGNNRKLEVKVWIPKRFHNGKTALEKTYCVEWKGLAERKTIGIALKTIGEEMIKESEL